MANENTNLNVKCYQGKGKLKPKGGPQQQDGMKWVEKLPPTSLA